MRMSFGVNCHSMDKPTKVITRKTVVIQGFTTPGHLNKAGNLFILPVNYHQGMILKRGRVIGYYSRRSKDITGFLEYKAEILNLPFFKNFKFNQKKELSIELKQWTGTEYINF